MKKEYDFSKAEQGKFYRPEKELERPVYLQKGVREFYCTSGLFGDMGLEEIVNKILIKEMEIIKAVAPGVVVHESATGRIRESKAGGALKGARGRR